jgi:predicted nucleic acid-binding protein
VRIYLNTSALSRPFDALSRSRARHEAEAVGMLVAAIEAQQVELVASEYLAFELSQHPDQEQAQRIATPLRLAKTLVKASVSVALRARSLEQFGLRGLDALHVASAEGGNVDLLVTTDDRMMKRAARARAVLHVRVLSPASAVAVIAEGGSREE